MYNAILADDDFIEDTGNVIFFSEEMGIVVDLNNINLHDANCYKDDPN